MSACAMGVGGPAFVLHVVPFGCTHLKGIPPTSWDIDATSICSAARWEKRYAQYLQAQTCLP